MNPESETLTESRKMTRQLRSFSQSLEAAAKAATQRKHDEAVRWFQDELKHLEMEEHLSNLKKRMAK